VLVPGWLGGEMVYVERVGVEDPRDHREDRTCSIAARSGPFRVWPAAVLGLIWATAVATKRNVAMASRCVHVGTEKTSRTLDSNGAATTSSGKQSPVRSRDGSPDVHA
jgi:hypothetical protein